MKEKSYVYSIGFDDEVLTDEGDVMTYTVKLRNGDTIKLICEISKATMEMEYYSFDPGKRGRLNIIFNYIIDLNDDGERWEGSSFNSLPFGFGRIYNSENVLKYQGYMFCGRKVVFGEEYYEDSKTLEYKGNFLCNRRHGRGILYDKGGLIVANGFWHFGESATQLIIPPKCNNIRFFTDCVKELIINDECFSDLNFFHIRNNCILEKLDVGDSCFGRIRKFMIDNCTELKSVMIGNNSFMTNSAYLKGQFFIQNCPKLEAIGIGDSSFIYCCERLELKSCLSIYC